MSNKELLVPSKAWIAAIVDFDECGAVSPSSKLNVYIYFA